MLARSRARGPSIQTDALTPRKAAARLADATLAALLLIALLFEAIGHRTGYWQLAAFGAGPDLALLYGIGRGLEQGQLHPRAVPLYNTVHRYPLPLALTALAVSGLLPLGYLVGGLAWCFHISLDRAIGYGLRTRDGHQRR